MNTLKYVCKIAEMILHHGQFSKRFNNGAKTHINEKQNVWLCTCSGEVEAVWCAIKPTTLSRLY